MIYGQKEHEHDRKKHRSLFCMYEAAHTNLNEPLRYKFNGPAVIANCCVLATKMWSSKINKYNTTGQ